MSARTQLQSKSVADLRAIADGLGLDHKGLQKAKLIDLLLEQGDEVIETEEPVVAEVISKNDDSDLPSVVNSGDSQVKAGESREGVLDILPEGYGFYGAMDINQVIMMFMFQQEVLRSSECAKVI